MTCAEFQRVLPENWGGHTIEQNEHLKSCSSCSDLVSDLNAISQQARLMQTSDEPSPRVWNSIEIALRQEGLIHAPRPLRSLLPGLRPGWRAAWLVPVTAVLLVALAALLFERGTGRPEIGQPTESSSTVNPAPHPERDLAALAEDEQLLKMVGARAPAFKAAYESDLKAVDSYIRDAEMSARNNPNDEISQQYLRNAYEQRAMVYEMALDRSLP